MRRRDFISFLASVAAYRSIVAHAQHAGMPVVGVLGSGSPAVYAERLTLIRRGLEETGFTESRTVAIEYRWAEGQLDRLPSLANELVARDVNVVVATGGLQAVHAAMTATNTIPIVFSTDGDPVRQGLVSNLNRPSGNATGITVFSASLTAKRLEIFRQIVPKTKIIGVLINLTAEQAAQQTRDAEEAARSLGLETHQAHCNHKPIPDSCNLRQTRVRHRGWPRQLRSQSGRALSLNGHLRWPRSQG